jgi:hydrogenase nickel incorporation protein HypA/HybF
VHELSIAQAIVDIASRHARGRRVYRVQLRVGHLRQVVPSALAFAFELLTEGTPLEGAELVIEDVPARGRCRACGAETALTTFPLRCESCGGLDQEMVAGEELLVDALELEGDLTTPPPTSPTTPPLTPEMTTEGIAHGG